MKEWAQTMVLLALVVVLLFIAALNAARLHQVHDDGEKTRHLICSIVSVPNDDGTYGGNHTPAKVLEPLCGDVIDLGREGR